MSPTQGQAKLLEGIPIPAISHPLKGELYGWLPLSDASGIFFANSPNLHIGIFIANSLNLLIGIFIATAPICLSASSLLSMNPEKFDMASLSIEKEIRHKKRQKGTSSYAEQTIG